MKNTIFAPATAPGKAGVGIIRISGPNAKLVMDKMTNLKNPEPRSAILTKLRTVSGEVIDQPIVIYFPNPNSFTGEDVVELHMHGGRAIIKKTLTELEKLEDFRYAERGEFTRRAVENGKMDLTSAEGMADLIDAETEEQRKQALRQMDGALARIYEDWRADLVHLLAWIEAYIDFPEEEIPDDVASKIVGKIKKLQSALSEHLSDDHRGEILRDGFQICIIGEPNVGKSSLMNKLAQKDVAIVSSVAGTTRDIIEVRLDIRGFPVVIADTAGIRETDEEIEAEGVRRAKKRAQDADLILSVYSAEDFGEELDENNQKNIINHFENETNLFRNRNMLRIINKIDKAQKVPSGLIPVSAKTEEGLEELLNIIGDQVERTLNLREEPSLTRLRHRNHLNECLEFLNHSLTKTDLSELELMAEDLRMAMRALGKITGQVQIDELLDIIFSDFCIGK
ncbi:MAG: tRNA uridine-5-carboxymethylaminomethyl(34) synthesis GTPase MnmE [Alphaproteobacteria bacterium]|nr:tRNA uridine-5-carboxymethylaminomethyl(34) synthesis GTPase MnmE [Alphaproteobacteria bacterium]